MLRVGSRGLQPAPRPALGAESETGTRAGSWRAAAAACRRIKCQGSKGVYQPVIHYVRDTDTVHGSDFMFMGLWRALQWICVFRMNIDTKIPSVFSQWSPYNQSGRWYHMCKTNRDHKNTYLSKLVLQAVVVSQINFACFWNWNSDKQKSGKDVRNYFLI